MAKIKFYLDKRGLVGKDATLKIKITSHGVGAYIPLNLHILPSQWNERREKIVGHPQDKALNLYLQKKILAVEEFVRELPSGMNGKQMADAVKKSLDKDSEQYTNGNLFLQVFRAFEGSRTAQRTQDLYSATRKAMMAYDADLDVKAFDDIDVTWLEKFDKHLRKTSPAINARAIHYRNIRAVFNYAMKILKLKINYPFYDFKIKTESTAKRSLTIEQLRRLINEDWYSGMRQQDAKALQVYIDIFKLQIYLCGIRPIDLAYLKKSDMVGDRIEYKSQKTGTFYSVKLEPEAMEIINKYPGNEYLLFISEYYKSYRNFFARASKAMQKLGYSGITAYWARHTWATLAAELDIPIETISQGLGHLIGKDVTLVYVAFKQKKVDDANRQVIDYIRMYTVVYYLIAYFRFILRVLKASASSC